MFLLQKENANISIAATQVFFLPTPLKSFCIEKSICNDTRLQKRVQVGLSNNNFPKPKLWEAAPKVLQGACSQDDRLFAEPEGNTLLVVPISGLCQG